MKYLLSKLIPVRMHSHYREGDANGRPVAATWWQWRDRIFGHRTISL